MSDRCAPFRPPCVKASRVKRVSPTTFGITHGPSVKQCNVQHGADYSLLHTYQTSPRCADRVHFHKPEPTSRRRQASDPCAPTVIYATMAPTRGYTLHRAGGRLMRVTTARFPLRRASQVCRARRNSRHGRLLRIRLVSFLRPPLSDPEARTGQLSAPVRPLIRAAYARLTPFPARPRTLYLADTQSRHPLTRQTGAAAVSNHRPRAVRPWRGVCRSAHRTHPPSRMHVYRPTAEMAGK
ncbi:hypothetical protein BD413DRAFT_51828 [Trametes elegans]|nr:hypothetical protein BD413DRAFT_51828 [Trametes elegans]